MNRSTSRLTLQDLSRVSAVTKELIRKESTLKHRSYDLYAAVLLLISALGLLIFAGCARQSAVSLEGKPLTGHVQMTEVQAAYMGSGNAGSGTLSYYGNTYPFKVAGLGVAGIGLSKIDATGEVYGMQRINHFAGVSTGDERISEVSIDLFEPSIRRCKAV